MIRLFRGVSADLRRNRLRNMLSSLSMLLGVLGLATVALIRSIAADVLVVAEEQRNGREPTYSVAVEVSGDSAVVSASTLADRLAELAPEASHTLSVEIESTVLIALPGASLNDPGTGIQVTWASNRVDAVRRIITSVDHSPPLPLAGLTVNRAYAERSHLSTGDVVAVRWTREAPPVQVVIVEAVVDGISEPRAYGSFSTLALVGAPLSTTTAHVRVHAPPGLGAEAITRWVSDAATDTATTMSGPVQRTDTVAQVREQLAQLETLFLIVGVTLLIVAAVGLLNVNLATVDQRSRELAIRRAVGVRRRDVVALVLGSSIALAVPVTTVATVVAFASSVWLIPALLPPAGALALPPFPWSAVTIAAAAALATSVVGAAAPAAKAARVPIAESLRA